VTSILYQKFIQNSFSAMQFYLDILYVLLATGQYHPVAFVKYIHLSNAEQITTTLHKDMSANIDEQKLAIYGSWLHCHTS